MRGRRQGFRASALLPPSFSHLHGLRNNEYEKCQSSGEITPSTSGGFQLSFFLSQSSLSLCCCTSTSTPTAPAHPPFDPTPSLPSACPPLPSTPNTPPSRRDDSQTWAPSPGRGWTDSTVWCVMRAVRGSRSYRLPVCATSQRTNEDGQYQTRIVFHLECEQESRLERKGGWPELTDRPLPLALISHLRHPSQDSSRQRQPQLTPHLDPNAQLPLKSGFGNHRRIPRPALLGVHSRRCAFIRRKSRRRGSVHPSF